jgi:hypothetical protein
MRAAHPQWTQLLHNRCATSPPMPHLAAGRLVQPHQPPAPPPQLGAALRGTGGPRRRLLRLRGSRRRCGARRRRDQLVHLPLLADRGPGAGAAGKRRRPSGCGVIFLVRNRTTEPAWCQATQHTTRRAHGRRAATSCPAGIMQRAAGSPRTVVASTTNRAATRCTPPQRQTTATKQHTVMAQNHGT